MEWRRERMESWREREKAREKEKETERERECVCVLPSGFEKVVS